MQTAEGLKDLHEVPAFCQEVVNNDKYENDDLRRHVFKQHEYS